MSSGRFWMWLDERVLRCRVQWVCDINDHYYFPVHGEDGVPTTEKGSE